MATTALERGVGKGARGERDIAGSLSEYGRGVAGGLLFSLPLLYTQEVWKAGALFGPGRLAASLAGTLLLLLGYNRYAGLRSDAGGVEVLIDSVEELGLGMAVAALLLWLIGQIDATMSLAVIVGRVVTAGTLAAIGVSVGTAQLGGGADVGEDEDEEGDGGTHGLVVLAVCGAVLIAANVAPTEEVLLIAARVDEPRLLGLILTSLVLTAVICFYSEFVGARRGAEGPTALEVVRETVITYGVALAVSAGILWLFGRIEDLGPLAAWARIVVLGVPAALGASAGRLIIKGAQ
jgi:putative integral membrane protein (TIGR02587 family)